MRNFASGFKCGLCGKTSPDGTGLCFPERATEGKKNGK
jgi:hypothetical protein